MRCNIEQKCLNTTLMYLLLILWLDWAWPSTTCSDVTAGQTRVVVVGEHVVAVSARVDVAV